jgi:hypothetical protein
MQDIFTATAMVPFERGALITITQRRKWWQLWKPRRAAYLVTDAPTPERVMATRLSGWGQLKLRLRGRL